MLETITTPECQPGRIPLPNRHAVLIVEDDSVQAQVLARRLEHIGFDILLAHSGLEGIEFARRRRPDLIVMDLLLPDIDGLQAAERLADDVETAAIPIIMLSAMERPDIIRRSRAAGCQYYVRKPYDPNALLLLIENALRSDV